MPDVFTDFDFYDKIFIPIFAAIIGAVVTIFVTRSSTNRQISVQYKTDKRLEWIQSVRTTLSEFISYALDYYEKMSYTGRFDNDKKYEIMESCHYELNRRQAQLKLYFNFRDSLDDDILKSLDRIIGWTSEEYEDINDEQFIAEIGMLTKLSQIYLKLEWERCKMEVDGVKKKKVETRLEDLGQEYRKELDIDAV